MKRLIGLGVCVLLIFGLAVSIAPAAQSKETPEIAQKEQASAIKELTIRNSGFRSRATVVIRYRDEDKKIVEVIENGKKLPVEEFARYESLIQKVLEIPEIDRLLPDIERARRLAESPRISEELKIREMLELRRRLEGLESDVARHYRDINEFQLMNQLDNLSEKISESSDLSQEEKIRQLKELLAKIQAMEFARVNEARHRRLAEIETANVAKRLIEEIERTDALSKEEKVKEIRDILQQHMQDRELEGEARHRDLIEFEAANALRKMLQDTAQRKDLSDQEKEKEFKFLLEEARKMKLETSRHMIGIEKFKFDLHQFLKNEGLLPEGEATFELRLHKCSIDGKKLPEEIHRKILQLCEESLGKKFERDTRIILDLNEDR